MGEVPLQIINEVSADKQRQIVYLYLFSRINVFDSPDEKNQEVSARSFIYTSFSESKQRLLLKGISELNILGRAGLIRQNLEILEGYYADGNSATTGNSLLSRSFTDHVQEKKYGNSQTIKSLIEETTKELDKRHEALLEDYGKVKVEELSPIEKIFFLHGQELTEKNLNKYLSLLKAIEKGAIETEELIKGVDESNYEELQNISRLTDINTASMLSWEAREKLLTAWAEKGYLADNGWLGYDERKVIELLAKAPRADSENLITFFKNNNHQYLLKFYDDLNDAGGVDNNTLFIETLVEVSKQLLEDRIATADGSTEAEKIFDLFEKGDIRGIFYSVPSSDCQPFGFSENSTTSYKISSKWCYCSGSDLETQMPCEEKVLSSVDDLSPLDLTIIIKGKDLSVLQPEYYQDSEFQAEVVPAIYFKYGQKERSVEGAKKIGTGVFTVASVVIPGTLMVRAIIARRYLAATIAAADLVANTLAEIAASQRVIEFLTARYGKTNATAFITVSQGISMLTGNVNAPVNTIKAANLAEEITKTTKNLSEGDLQIFVNISDDLANNAKTLIDKGEFTAEQLAEIKKTATFVREDLARSGKTIGVGEQIADGGKWLGKFDGLGLTDDLVKRLTKKFDDLGFSEEQVDGFISDIVKGGDGFVLDISKNEGLVVAWKRFGDSPLRTNTKYLEGMTDFPPAWKIETNGGVTKILNGNGDELAELTEDLVKAKGGSKGSWNELLNKPPVKSHKYQVDRYLYETDELGRVKKVKGELEYVERGRNEYQQGLSVDLKDGIKGQDDGGHLIANILNGPGEQINYLPQTANLNRGGWKTMENAWSEALKNGSKVEVEITPIFDGTSKRPVKFEVDYWVDGKYKFAEFDN